MYKRDKNRAIDKDEKPGVLRWEGVEPLWPSEHITLPKSPYVHQPEPSEPYLFEFLRSVITQTLLIKSLPVGNWFNLHPLSPFPGDRVGYKFSVCLVLFSWPHPRCIPKEPHSHKLRCHWKGLLWILRHFLLYHKMGFKESFWNWQRPNSWFLYWITISPNETKMFILIYTLYLWMRLSHILLALLMQWNLF